MAHTHSPKVERLTESDRDEISDSNLTNVDQTEHEEYDVDERVHTPLDYELTNDEKIHNEENIDEGEDDDVTKELYDNVNVNLGNEDTEMTDADQGGSEQQNAFQQSGFEQEKEDAHVTLTPVLDIQKTGGPTQISSVSFNFTSKLLNLDNPFSADNEIASLMDTTAQEVNAQLPQILPQAISDVATPVIEKNVTKSLKANRSQDDKDKDQDPTAGSDRGTKRRKSSKDVESSRDSTSKEKKTSSTSKDASQSQHKSFGKSAHAEKLSHTVKDSGMQQDQEFVTGDNDEQPTDNQVAHAKEPPTSFDELNDTSFDFSAFVMNRLQIPNLTQEILVGLEFNLLKGTYKSITELEYHFEECSKAITKCLDWHNPENKSYSFDLKKPLLLIQDHQGRKIIPQDYFINNDIEYLKGRDLSRRYSTSVTKTKGTSHWGPKCQSFYGYASNMTSSKDVYSRNRIIAITRLNVIKMYDYGHLEEIEVRQDDHNLYTFREGDFKRLHIQDIEDMLLLLVQQKLTNLIIDKRDGTLNDVQSTLHDITARIRMEYMPMTKWSNLDKKQAWVMVQDIDKQLYQRRSQFRREAMYAVYLIELDHLPKVTKDEGNDGMEMSYVMLCDYMTTIVIYVWNKIEIIMVNVIPPDHVDDVPIVEPNQHDDVLVEEEDEPELTYPYEEVDPLNPSLNAFDSKPEDVIKVENTIESEDETIPASVHELGNAEEKAKCKKLKKELEEARFSNTFLLAIRRMIKESVDAAIAAERARHSNAGHDARVSGPVRGQDAALAIKECTFAGFMKCNPTIFYGTEGAVKLQRCQCTIKCHKCGKVRHKARYYTEKNVATGANDQPIPTCYDFDEKGHTRNWCPRKVKQEEAGEVRGRAYAIKDAEP
nr:hypothetical protein [Tanacetum cinerariifolium]